MGKDYSNKGEYRSPRAGRDRTSKKKESEGQTLDKKNPKYTEGGIIDTGELDKSGNPLMIKRDSTTQQGINRDKIKNQTGDQILDPEGNFKKGVYKRPSLEQLKRRAALGISTAGQVVRSTNPTGMVLPIVTGAASLMIKGMQRQLLGI
tara:strand:+ start:187 stop:633 length:447 start_codon:yes stop_codon:yes gene_type:complete